MQESENIKICNCNIPPKIQQDKMFDAIARYIEGIPAGECVEDKEYERRLAICEDCDGRMGPTCRYCGCFVLARAKRKDQECPMPGKNKWLSGDL
ncbi:MAG: hypothetical protein E7261_00775 [Lachnospiraceae bacterium]|nr:hypothetical protein [Lachnospiraceae bacterium]